MTIKDIARISGVSITTVSRVLNDRPDVSDESRRRVLDVIESTNYIPNNSARDLVKTKSDSIGIVVRGISNAMHLVSSRPSIPGMRISEISRSGFSLRHRSRADSPS